jgi:hypothetical protein
VEQGQSLRPAGRSAADIARQLREAFTREMYQQTGGQTLPDPVLGAVFHALAHQVDTIYREADHVFFAAALDDLIRGLGLPARLARPAQAVVQFSQVQKREPVTPDVELIGYRPNGEQIVFAPDDTIEIAPTELVFAGVYEGGRLQTIPGARLPWVNQPVLPGNAVALDLTNPAPMLLLAFETDESHLSRLGVFIEVSGRGAEVATALARSPWQILSEAGVVTEPGILRSTRTRGGMWRLKFFREPPGTVEPESALARAIQLAGGVYGSRLWVFPEIPRDRRTKSRIPPAVAGAVPKLLPQGQERALDRPLAWVQIPLPAGLRGVANTVTRIAVNCVTASNIEIWNEQIDFDRMGSVVTHRPMGSDRRHVMGVLSVVGENGDPYVATGDLEARAGTGRYRYRGRGQFEFAPAKQESGRFETYAMLRVLYCDGDEGNGIAPGEVKQIRTDLPNNPTARVTSLTPSKGGAAPPSYSDARDRFAEMLRTRDRLVTAADIDIAVRAFEPNLDRARIDVESLSEITDSGLGLVTRVTAHAARDKFADPEAELERLGIELEQYLSERAMIGHRIEVTIVPVEGDGR